MENVIQGSAEWLALRAGKVTASRVADVLAKTKTGYGASRANYLAELICERLTGQPAERFTNAAMAWGSEKEPEARSTYAFLNDVDVVEIGFVAHPTIANAGCSPDGLVGDAGLVEFKCPNSSTHIDTLLGQSVPEKYVKQIQFQLACTGRKWADFCSFDPRLPGHMQIFIRRIERDDAMIAEMEAEIVKFLGELETKLAALDQLYSQKEAAE